MACDLNCGKCKKYGFVERMENCVKSGTCKYYQAGYSVHSALVSHSLLMKFSGSKLNDKLPVAIANWFRGSISVWYNTLIPLALVTPWIAAKACVKHHPINKAVKAFWAGANDSSWDY